MDILHYMVSSSWNWFVLVIHMGMELRIAIFAYDTWSIKEKMTMIFSREEKNMKITFEGTVEEIREFLEQTKSEESLIDEIEALDDELNLSPYTRMFNDESPKWSDNAEQNRNFLVSMQVELNHKLRTDKYLRLNDVYDALGFPLTVTGGMVGWVYEHDNQFGDNFVDFGIYNK